MRARLVLALVSAAAAVGRASAQPATALQVALANRAISAALDLVDAAAPIPGAQPAAETHAVTADPRLRRRLEACCERPSAVTFGRVERMRRLSDVAAADAPPSADLILFAPTGGLANATGGLVLMHGYQQMAIDYVGFVAPLAERGVAVALLKYGESSIGDATVASWAQAVARGSRWLARKLEQSNARGSRVVAAGHSDGGRAALVAASQQDGAHLAGVAALAPHVAHDVVLGTNGTREVTLYPEPSLLARIEVPTLFVVGDLDCFTPARYGAEDAFAELAVRQKYLARLEGGTHQMTARGRRVRVLKALEDVMCVLGPVAAPPAIPYAIGDALTAAEVQRRALRILDPDAQERRSANLLALFAAAAVGETSFREVDAAMALLA